jgi:hypothetical protein
VLQALYSVHFASLWQEAWQNFQLRKLSNREFLLCTFYNARGFSVKFAEDTPASNTNIFLHGLALMVVHGLHYLE